MELFIALLAALMAIFGPIIVWQQTRINAKDAELAKSDELRRAELRADFELRVTQLRTDFEGQLERSREDCAARLLELEQRAVRWEQVALEGRSVIVRRAMAAEQAMEGAQRAKKAVTDDERTDPRGGTR